MIVVQGNEQLNYELMLNNCVNLRQLHHQPPLLVFIHNCSQFIFDENFFGNFSREKMPLKEY